ncbi:hypothetical protein I3F58_23570 [Streptomyces sp. MUM 203J]|uniref:hypothetical protein n=1 Tax=Streptomyces sp. MUM 203J TaxID=2791990 RepID=UPI001F046413|nr:hypothetical protein [Streptomyces sp. MUM 203J]MCH0542478.1 hypothetical protein [Streptomyces sp. MUM 203J]
MPNGALRAELLERQKRRESSARTYAGTLPVAPAHAAGAVVTGADGRTYPDRLSGAVLGDEQADAVLERLAAALEDVR